MIYSASSYDLLMQGVKPTAVFDKQGIIMSELGANVRDLQSSLEVLFNKNCDWSAFSFGTITVNGSIHLFGVAANGAQRWISLFGINFSHQNFCNLRLFIT